MKLFVYGSLKKSGSAHHLLKTAEFSKAIKTTTDYTLYSISWFPGMVKEKSNHGVEGELYEVSDFKALDRYEGTCFTKTEIELEDGTKSLTYLFNKSVSDCQPINDGIWRIV